MPLKATDFPFYYETDPINNEFDWSEETDDGVTSYFQAIDTQEDGYNLIHPNSATVTKIRIFFAYSLSASSYNYISIRLKTNVSDVNIYPSDNNLNVIGSTIVLTINTWTIIEWDISSDGDWTGTESGFMLQFDEEGGDSLMEEDNFVWVDTVRLLNRDTPSISTADSYAWCSSQNNSFRYRAEINSTLQGYYNDLEYFSTDQSLGIHTINCTVFDDTNRDGIVFISGSSVTSSYSVITDFYVSVENIYPSDDYMNIFVTSSKSGTYTVYENDSVIDSGSFNKAGTSISHTKDSTVGAFIDLAYKFVNGSDFIWFNTSYSNGENNDLCSLSIVDQSNYYVESKALKIYVDSVRIYSDSFKWINISSTRNITMTDLFDNLLWQNTAQTYSRFVDVVLTLYSVKIMNSQYSAVFVNVSRGTKYYAEWLMPFETTKYAFETDNYTVKLSFSNLNSNNYFSVENGSSASFTYEIVNASAIIIFGTTLDDIYVLQNSVYMSVRQLPTEPADPNIEIIEDDQAVIDALKERIDELEKQQRRDLTREVSFWGSLTTFAILLSVGVGLLALFREKEYQQLKNYLKEKGWELSEYLD